jgi:ADP-ribose pyrophosphatase
MLTTMMNDRRQLARAPWITVSSRPVYTNPWLQVREDVAEMPDGRRTIYGVVTTRPAVGVLPFLDAHTVVLVGQYRYVACAFMWEIPTGALNENERETDAAQRELAEEAGYRAGHLEKLCAFDTSKSVVDETAHIFLATDLTPVRHEPDATEFIEVRTFPFAEVVRMVEKSEIADAMTVVAVLHAARRRGL